MFIISLPLRVFLNLVNFPDLSRRLCTQKAEDYQLTYQSTVEYHTSAHSTLRANPQNLKHLKKNMHSTYICKIDGLTCANLPFFRDYLQILSGCLPNILRYTYCPLKTMLTLYCDRSRSMQGHTMRRASCLPSAQELR